MRLPQVRQVRSQIPKLDNNRYFKVFQSNTVIVDCFRKMSRALFFLVFWKVYEWLTLKLMLHIGGWQTGLTIINTWYQVPGIIIVASKAKMERRRVA